MPPYALKKPRCCAKHDSVWFGYHSPRLRWFYYRTFPLFRLIINIYFIH
ncbi:hypothetical protein HMPREF1985_02333 [Mitsuokella sp. oral taxon 131 str. W9106]|nr:hypothetical protein HMPREF1985_02333 [Mitsuokella sp. oral taxon 131 str. W9106]